MMMFHQQQLPHQAAVAQEDYCYILLLKVILPVDNKQLLHRHIQLQLVQVEVLVPVQIQLH